MDEDNGRDRGDMTLGELFARVRVSTAAAVLGLVVVGIGSIGPWASTVLGSAAGTRGDGKITLGLAGFGLLALALGRGRGAGLIAAAAAVVAALAVAGYDLVHIEYETSKVTLFGHRVATAGWGVYAAVAGSALAGVGLANTAARVVRYLATAFFVVGAAGVIVAGAALEGRSTNAQSASAISIPTIPTDTTPSDTTPTETTSTGTDATATGGNASGDTAGAAPHLNVGPTPQRLVQCDQNISGGPNTSCPFAENVFKAVARVYQGKGYIPAQVSAFSPVTSRTYSLSCVIKDIDWPQSTPPKDQEVDCAASDSDVTFSAQSVYVY